MRAEPLRIAIVGCGRMGLQHARNVTALGHSVAIACDVDRTRALALAATHAGCAALTDAGAICWGTIDAGFVCTPPFARGPVELLAARAGVPLFLEKPIGLSAAQLLPALSAVLESGATTSVGYMNRYRTSVRKAKKILEGEEVLGFVAHWVCAAYHVPWWGDPALSGGQLNEQCTHLIDLARDLCGEVAEVRGFAQPGPVEGATDSASVVLRFRSGALGTILCGCLAEQKQIGCRVFTPRGQIVLEGCDFRWTSSALGGGKACDPVEDVFAAECAAFLQAVRTGDVGGIQCDLAEAIETQRVVDAARAALEIGPACKRDGGTVGSALA